jgi:hypothetical protein
LSHTKNAAKVLETVRAAVARAEIGEAESRNFVVRIGQDWSGLVGNGSEERREQIGDGKWKMEAEESMRENRKCKDVQIAARISKFYT